VAVAAFDHLAQWLDRRTPTLEGLGLKVRLTWGPCHRDPAAAWLDIESATRSARLMLWSNGEADLVIGDFVKKEVLLEEHREIATEVGLEDAEATITTWLT
jgi:hypothetical protein